MNTNYDEEATQILNPKSESTTQYYTPEQKGQTLTKGDSSTNSTKPKAVNNTLKQVAVGVGSGVLIGGLASGLVSMVDADFAHPEPGQTPIHPDWVDDHMHVASNVNDNMSFDEAFTAARHEVGPGGCFEWHGQVYNTYTASEWNNMTAEQRAEFGEHFNWDHFDSGSANFAHHTIDTGDQMAQVEPHGPQDFIDPSTPVESPVEYEPNMIEPIGEVPSDATFAIHEAEIEILGVVHDADSGANIGTMSVDGQEVVLIDVDGDMEFDYMASDLDGNGQLDQYEVVDIHEHGLSVDEFGGQYDLDDSLAMNDDHEISVEDTYGDNAHIDNHDMVEIHDSMDSLYDSDGFHEFDSHDDMLAHNDHHDFADDGFYDDGHFDHDHDIVGDDFGGFHDMDMNHDMLAHDDHQDFSADGFYEG